MTRNKASSIIYTLVEARKSSNIATTHHAHKPMTMMAPASLLL
jgi:hypothetical protein